MSLFFKKTIIPTSNEVKEIETVQLWQVTWYSRYDSYSHSTNKEFEVFTSEPDAIEFAESLRAAYKLLRHTCGTEVKLEKRQ